MKVPTAFTLIILGSMIFSSYLTSQLVTAEDFAPRILKQNALASLESLEIHDKKDQKKVDNAVKEIKKSLDEKLWEDDSSLTMLGKKVFSHEKKAVNELDKIKSIDVSAITITLVESDRFLVQLVIDEIPTDTDDKKINKNLKKILKEMNDAQKDFDKNKLEKVVDHYKKAWKLAFMGDEVNVVEEDFDTSDENNDGIPDYYVSLKYTEDPKQPTKISYKIQDECVDLGPKDASDVGGDTYDDAAMMIGVTNTSKSVWFIDDMIVWNDWFKKKNNDDNQMVDLVFSPSRFLPHFEDLHGDNVIRGDAKKTSFEHFTSIPELGGQSGWEGFLYFNAPSGDYLFWTVHPAGGIDECDRLAAQGILVTIP